MVLVGLHQQFLQNEITMNVAVVSVILEKPFKQAVNSLRYTRSYLLSTQHNLQQLLLEFAHHVGAFFCDEPLGRELGCAKQTCIALLMQAESEVIDSLWFLIHVCLALAG